MDVKEGEGVACGMLLLRDVKSLGVMEQIVGHWYHYRRFGVVMMGAFGGRAD